MLVLYEKWGSDRLAEAVYVISVVVAYVAAVAIILVRMKVRFIQRRLALDGLPVRDDFDMDDDRM